MKRKQTESEGQELSEEFFENPAPQELPVAVVLGEPREAERDCAMIPMSVKTSTIEELQEVTEKPKRRRLERLKGILREHFSAPRIAYMAIFTALAYAVCWIEFSVFPAASFLKLDFANVFFLFEGFIFGPVEAFVSIAIKELLCFGTKSSTGGVGEIANLIMSTAYILVPAVAYRFKRGKRWVGVYLACACVVQMGLSLLVNRYINFPFFMGEGAAAVFEKLGYWVLAFNAIKSVAVSVIVFLIYKPLSRFVKSTTEKFDRRMAKAKGKRKSTEVAVELAKENPSEETQKNAEE